jgi:hypothetical protein
MLTGPEDALAGTTAVILLSETTVKVVSVPLIFTEDVPAIKPFPFNVTVVPAGPDNGITDEITGATQGVVTVPFKTKLSNLNEPVPVALLRVKTIVTFPVNPVTGLVTAVIPVDAPVVGTVPLPTAVPLMVIDQFCGAEGVLPRQKLYESICNCFPAATSNVKVITGLEAEGTETTKAGVSAFARQINPIGDIGCP